MWRRSMARQCTNSARTNILIPMTINMAFHFNTSGAENSTLGDYEKTVTRILEHPKNYYNKPNMANIENKCISS